MIASQSSPKVAIRRLQGKPIVVSNATKRFVNQNTNMLPMQAILYECSARL